MVRKRLGDVCWNVIAVCFMCFMSPCQLVKRVHCPHLVAAPNTRVHCKSTAKTTVYCGKGPH